MFINQPITFSSTRCNQCNRIISLSFSSSEVLCESCKTKNKLVKGIRWAAIAGISFIPQFAPFAGVCASLMTVAGTNSTENKSQKQFTNLIGNPNPNQIYELHNHIWLQNKQLKLKESENSFLSDQVKRLKQEKLLLARELEQRNLIGDLHIERSIPWRRMVDNPKHFGIQRLESVKLSTRLEYLDHQLWTDIFIPEPEGKGLLHGGIPIDIITPMIYTASIKRFTYSLTRNQISHPIERIY